MRAPSGAEALDTLNELRRRGEQVALLIADQRMPGMEGTEYLTKARTIFPDAKRVLLTAYADTDAAIAAINKASLDYYLLKPWDPPEEELYPVVEDLLGDWQAGSALTIGGVRVIGHRFSKESHDLRDFLARNRVPGRFLDVERDGEARELLTVAGVADDRLPVAMLEDGSVIERPTILELAERLGVTGTPSADHYDLVIVGGGPAGLAAAVYGASEGLKTVLVEREAPGGQAGQSSRIENYLGFPTGLTGSDLARRATDQARRLGAELLTVRDAEALRVEGAGRVVALSGGGELSANCVLVASGVVLPPARHPRVPGADRGRHLLRRGDDRGPLVPRPARRRHRRRELGGAGGGLLQRVRAAGDDPRAAHARGLDVALPHRADRQPAEHRRPHGHHRDRRGGRRSPLPPARGGARRPGGPACGRVLRVHRGAAPHRLAGRRRRARRARLHPRRPRCQGRGWPLPREPYLLETTVPGVFVAGDVRARSIKRVASAVGEGSMSVSLVHQYLVDG